MAENGKGFSLRSLFYRDTETGEQEKPIQEVKPINQQIPSTPVVVPEQSLVDDFVQRIQNLIDQNNQSGFDFLEFTESLFEEKQNPSPEVYKTVFRIAQKMDKSLTPKRLLDSSMYYKDLVQRTAETEVSKGESKKQGLLSDKETERTNLDNSLKDTRTKIQQLTLQIQEFQNLDTTLSNQLYAIDQKYGIQLIEIDRKIGAIRNAKEQVLVSIVDVEAGINANLS